jgi:RAT1-interacting protein
VSCTAYFYSECRAGNGNARRHGPSFAKRLLSNAALFPPVNYHKTAEITALVPNIITELPSLRDQIELGNFSRVGEREHVNGASRRAYIVEPPAIDVLSWDLNVAYESRTPKDPAINTKLDHLLRWITENFSVFTTACESEEISSLHTDFICYRSLLTKIMCTIHERSRGWVMGATKYRDSIYMCQYKPGRRALNNEAKQRQTAWRLKFEQYVTADRPGGQPNPYVPVNENEVVYTVARTHLGKHNSIIFAARVEAVDANLTQHCPELQESPARYVELRTARRIDDNYQQTCLFKYMLKWWAQASLLGVPRIICGYRDDNGVVESVRSYNTTTLGELGRPYWKTTDALMFLDVFLQFVQQHTVENNYRKVVLFEYNPESRTIKAMTLPKDDVNYEKYQVLPNWYFDDMEERFVAD